MYLLSVFLFLGALYAQPPESVIQIIQKETGSRAFLETLRKEFCFQDSGCDRSPKQFCESKIVFSLCQIVCEQERMCARSIGPNPPIVYVPQEAFENQQTPAHYVLDTLKLPHKTSMEAYVLCGRFCPLVISRKNPLFLPGIEGDLRTSCVQGCPP